MYHTTGTCFVQGQACVKGTEADQFKPEEAAQQLRAAMKGLGTDEWRIIRVLTDHTNQQRQVIKDTYKTSFGRDLIDDLKDDLGGNFLRLCVYLMLPEREFDARCLHYAIHNHQCDTLIDILATRTNSRIHGIRQIYEDLYQRDLDRDLDEYLLDVVGDFRRVLTGLAQGGRSEERTVDQAEVDKDVEELFKAGVGRLGTDEDVFTRILVTRSVPHLRDVFDAYHEKHQQQIEAAIEQEMSGNAKAAFLAIVRCVRDPLTHFATCFHETFKGPGTDDERLMQLIVSHSEVDLQDIADKYEGLFSRKLKQDIRGETSGDYRKLLMKIMDQAEEEE
nr:hypothetical protein BaRGS_001658 [Batillaria attramentaria]